MRNESKCERTAVLSCSLPEGIGGWIGGRGGGEELLSLPSLN